MKKCLSHRKETVREFKKEKTRPKYTHTHSLTRTHTPAVYVALRTVVYMPPQLCLYPQQMTPDSKKECEKVCERVSEGKIIKLEEEEEESVGVCVCKLMEERKNFFYLISVDLTFLGAFSLVIVWITEVLRR